MDKNIVKQYLRSFNSALQNRLVKGAAIECSAYSFDGGCVVVVKFKMLDKPVVAANYVVKEVSSYKEALTSIQVFEENSLQNLTIERAIHYFSDRILICKKDANEEWTERAAIKDCEMIIANL